MEKSAWKMLNPLWVYWSKVPKCKILCSPKLVIDRIAIYKRKVPKFSEHESTWLEGLAERLDIETKVERN
jgi:hypothetical protein